MSAPFTQNSGHARCQGSESNRYGGVFPSVIKPTAPIVLRQAQQARLDDAVKASLWRPLFNDDDDTLIVQ